MSNSATDFSGEMHEQALVRAFLLKSRQERCAFLLASPKRRCDFLKELAHFKWLEPAYCKSMLPASHHARDIAKILLSKGSGPTCWAVSEWGDLDGKELLLQETLQKIVGSGMGTFLSCVPGKLAYFEDEEESWILER